MSNSTTPIQDWKNFLTDVNEFRGDMTERNLRHEVRKMYGDAYGDAFVIQGVDGLIRLARGSKRQVSKGLNEGDRIRYEIWSQQK